MYKIVLVLALKFDLFLVVANISKEHSLALYLVKFEWKFIINLFNLIITYISGSLQFQIYDLFGNCLVCSLTGIIYKTYRCIHLVDTPCSTAKSIPWIGSRGPWRAYLWRASLVYRLPIIVLSRFYSPRVWKRGQSLQNRRLLWCSRTHRTGLGDLKMKK